MTFREIRAGRPAILVVAAVTLSVCCPSYGNARPDAVAVETSGDLVVTDPHARAVLRVDPVTGDRTIVSDASTGAGPVIAGLADIAVEASGDLVVLGSALDIVFRVDPVTGDRFVVSSHAVGAGPTFASPRDLAVESTGDLVVVDLDLEAIIRVDPVTGDRTIVSDPATGAGPAFSAPIAIAVEASGDLVVVDFGLAAVVRVHPVTGDRTIVSDAATGTGSPLSGPRLVATDASGTIVVSGESSAAKRVVRVDPVTGDRTTISSSTIGTGPEFTVSSIAVEASGDLVTTSSSRFDLAQMLRIDPVTGDRTPIAATCPIAPNPACTTGFARGKLVVKENIVGKEKLFAKLLRGPEISQADFGDPTDATAGPSFATCIYDDADTLIASLVVENAGDLCFVGGQGSERLCWKSTGGDPPHRKRLRVQGWGRIPFGREQDQVQSRRRRQIEPPNQGDREYRHHDGARYNDKCPAPDCLRRRCVLRSDSERHYQAGWRRLQSKVAIWQSIMRPLCFHIQTSVVATRRMNATGSPSTRRWVGADGGCRRCQLRVMA